MSNVAFKPSKQRGQHFLISDRVRDRIIAAAELTGSETVLEIGPGQGALTFELARRARRVIVVEIDPVLARRLGEILRDAQDDNGKKQDDNKKNQGDQPKVEIINADALKIPSSELRVTSYIIVANLPYQITSPFFKKFLEHGPAPSRIVVMIQKEVADRILAGKGSMNPLAILVQLSGRTELITRVSSASFFPQPRVASTVIRVKDIAWPPRLPRKEFMRLVHVGFASPRKKLAVNLSKLAQYGQKQVESALQSIGLDKGIRPQDTTSHDWVRLYHHLYPGKQ